MGLEVVYINETEITLDWDDTPDAESYTYQYRETGALEWSEGVEVSESTAVITELTEGTEYEFQVSAKNSIGQSLFTEQPVSDTPRFITPFVTAGGLWGPFPDDEDDPHFWKDDLAWVIGSIMFGLVFGATLKNPTAAFAGAAIVLAVGAIMTQEITPLTVGFFAISGIGAGFSFFIMSRG